MAKDFIDVVKRRYIERVPIDKILYVERNKRKVRIVTTDQTHEFYTTMEEVVEKLDNRFYLCLKYCAINFERVTKMEDQVIYFDTGDTYLLGKDNYGRTKQRYYAYIKHII
ncbi:MAG TPA: LytTR family DNA-binding domain-containing protein [Anaerovoracaceae bacterium]|nr:LytTR family DNA-binding domain-containing protein [Anaerovoracaceae bacterium]